MFICRVNARSDGCRVDSPNRPLHVADLVGNGPYIEIELRYAVSTSYSPIVGSDTHADSGRLC